VLSGEPIISLLWSEDVLKVLWCYKHFVPPGLQTGATLWSAMTRHRFSPRRFDATL
jgi:hypothetical protein